MTARPHRTHLPVIIVSALTLLMLLPAIALAHAELEATVPADEATVVGTPTELSATFSEALTAESTLSIRTASGDRLAVGGLDPADPARLVITPVPDLAPGTYEMRWTAFTDDGHIERDTWTFTVESPPPTASPTASPTDEPSAAATAAPTVEPTATASPAPSPSPSPGDGDPTAGTGDVLLPIVAALAVVAVGGVLLLGRRGRPGPTG